MIESSSTCMPSYVVTKDRASTRDTERLSDYRQSYTGKKDSLYSTRQSQVQGKPESRAKTDSRDTKTVRKHADQRHDKPRTEMSTKKPLGSIMNLGNIIYSEGHQRKQFAPHPVAQGTDIKVIMKRASKSRRDARKAFKKAWEVLQVLGYKDIIHVRKGLNSHWAQLKTWRHMETEKIVRAVEEDERKGPEFHKFMREKLRTYEKTLHDTSMLDLEDTEQDTNDICENYDVPFKLKHAPYQNGTRSLPIIDIKKWVRDGVYVIMEAAFYRANKELNALDKNEDKHKEKIKNLLAFIRLSKKGHHYSNKAYRYHLTISSMMGKEREHLQRPGNAPEPAAHFHQGGEPAFTDDASEKDEKTTEHATHHHAHETGREGSHSPTPSAREEVRERREEEEEEIERSGSEQEEKEEKEEQHKIHEEQDGLGRFLIRRPRN